MRLTEILEHYFGPDGELDECSFETLMDFADTIYTRYETLEAFEDCQKSSTWSEEIYGRSAPEPSTETDTSVVESISGTSALC